MKQRIPSSWYLLGILLLCACQGEGLFPNRQNPCQLEALVITGAVDTYFYRVNGADTVWIQREGNNPASDGYDVFTYGTDELPAEVKRYEAGSNLLLRRTELAWWDAETLQREAIYYDGELFDLTEFSPQGDWEKRYRYRNGAVFSEETFVNEYDADDQLLRTVQYNAQGDTSFIKVFEYDRKGNLILIRETGSPASPNEYTRETEISYGSRDREIERVTRDLETNDLLSRQTFEYTDGGKERRASYFNDADELIRIFVSIVDEFDNVVSIANYRPGKTEPEFMIAYNWDCQ